MNTLLRLPLIASALVLLLSGCGGSEGGSAGTGADSFFDASITSLDNLGWLGGASQPLTRALTIEVDGEKHSPGGVVLRELVMGAPLIEGGARSGDVIVRIGETWVPLKENPALDVLRLVEQSVSGGKTSVELGLYRRGAIETCALSTRDLPALEVGLPVSVERFAQGAAAAARRLVALQGGAESSPRPALDALTGLALLAAGSGGDASPDFGDAVSAVRARLEARLSGDAAGLTPLDLSLGTVFLAESIGPLPAEIVLRGPRKARVLKMKAPAGLPGGGHGMVTMQISGSGPPGNWAGGEGGEDVDLSELMSGGHAEMQVFTTGGDDEPPPELLRSLGIPEGMKVQKLDGGSFHGLPEVHGGAGGGPPPADLATLLAEHDPDRAGELERLGVVVEKLIAGQAEDGGWGDAGASESERLLLTSEALFALGCARRVGLEVAGEPVEKGVGFLRPLVHEGKVAAAIARGGDRRVEAGRTALVASALLSLGCPESDDMLSALLQVSDDIGRYVVEAKEGVAFGLLSTATLRRQRGLVTWQKCYDDFRLRLVAGQRPDGSFAPFSKESGIDGIGGDVFDTAVGALVLSLQKEGVPVLLARAENPFAPVIDGEGKVADAAAAGEMPVMEGNLDLSDPAQLQKILEKLGAEGSVQIKQEGGE
jgi:hypothetical protein